MRALRYLGVFALFTGLVFAETITGHLMPTNCKDRDPKTHTRDCAIGCADSGFGVVTAEGKWIKFDKAGDAKALAALKATSRKDDIHATVTGSRSGESFAVEKIEIAVEKVERR